MAKTLNIHQSIDVLPVAVEEVETMERILARGVSAMGIGAMSRGTSQSGAYATGQALVEENTRLCARFRARRGL